MANMSQHGVDAMVERVGGAVEKRKKGKDGDESDIDDDDDDDESAEVRGAR